MSFQQTVTADARLASDFPGGIVAGATVRTPCGERRIEALRPGDMVVTRCEGLKPVRMVLSREVSREEFLKAPERAPIRITPRAVGPMMPQRPLMLAADHKVLVPGYRVEDQPDDTPVFACASDLVHAHDHVRMDKSLASVTYYHLVFDAHVVFLVNGLPVESFSAAAKSLSRIHPEVLRRLEAAIPELRSADMRSPAGRFKTPDKLVFLPSAF